MRFFFLCLALLLPTAAQAAPETATINGAEISYEVCGAEAAPAVVLLHDGLVNSAAWDAVWEPLCRDYRVLRYDRRGYGRSPRAEVRHVPIEDLAGLMKHVGMGHAHLIGASVGAGLAVEFLFSYPEAIDKLVLVAPALSGFRPSDDLIARLQILDAAMRAGGIDMALAAIQDDPHLLPSGDEHALAALSDILKKSPGDLGAHPGQIRAPAIARRLSEVYAPTLVLVGASDAPFTLAQAGIVQRGMRAATLQTVPDAGQLLYLERPETFIERVRAFLN